jgi:4-hydroxy-3-methylbut-2-enyl diphosphate reductase
LCDQVQSLLVVGSKNSSNSSRLAELGTEHGIPSHLIDSVKDVDPSWFDGIDVVGLSSGASAPEDLVQDVVAWMRETYPELEVENWVTMQEKLKFPLPAELAS